MSSPELIAYLLNPAMEMPIIPAPLGRNWMNNLPDRFAHRCLPMLIANQSGWWILSGNTFEATWEGGACRCCLKVNIERGAPVASACSHFGHGVLTFTMPYLFRTSPGWNLLARGPANIVKDGIAPLEGLVESDWNSAPFTMNWKFTRPGTVRFEQGEPICQLVPQQRCDLEAVTPRMAPMAGEVKREYEAWAAERAAFIEALQAGEEAAVAQGWQKDYVKQALRTRLRLKEF